MSRRIIIKYSTVKYPARRRPYGNSAAIRYASALFPLADMSIIEEDENFEVCAAAPRYEIKIASLLSGIV